MPEHDRIQTGSKWPIVLSLWLWFGILLATHVGVHSPYSYGAIVFQIPARQIGGLVVNWDAATVRLVTMLFYEPVPVHLKAAYNLTLPLHSFVVSVFAGFLRSYMLANYAANLAALWLLSYIGVVVALRSGVSRGATLLAGLACGALPLYGHYVGQPIQYIVGPVINFALILAAITYYDDRHAPLIFGAIFAILVMNYDFYVFAAALLTWLLVGRKLPSLRALGTFAVTAALPLILWRLALRLFTPPTRYDLTGHQFFGPILGSWLKVIREPSRLPVTVYGMGHVGLAVAAWMTLAMIYWPLLLMGIAGLYMARNEGTEASAAARLMCLLVGWFLLEQFLTASYDIENNPRRAIPLVLAFSWAFFYVAGRFIDRPAWRSILIAVTLFSLFLAMADTIVGSPLVAYLNAYQSVKVSPTAAVLFFDSKLAPHAMPMLTSDPPGQLFDIKRATVEGVALPIFLVAQVLLGGLIVLFFRLLAGAELLPRRSATVAAGVIVLSLVVRFAV